LKSAIAVGEKTPSPVNLLKRTRFVESVKMMSAGTLGSTDTFV